MGTEWTQGHYVWTTVELGKKNKGQNVFIILISSLRCQLRGQVRQRNVSKVQEMQDIKNYLGWQNWLKSS